MRRPKLDRGAIDLDTRGVEQPADRAQRPVGHELGPRQGVRPVQFDGLLEEVGHRLALGQEPGVVAAQPVLVLETVAARVGQLRHAPSQRIDPLGADDQRRQVRLREVAVVVGLLLASLADRHGPGVVPATGLLDHALARLEQPLLPLDLELKGAVDGPKAVHVLDLDLGDGELRRALRSKANVGVAAEAPLLHPPPWLTPRYWTMARIFTTYCHASSGERRSGSPDDFHQRGAGAVEVDQAVALARRARAVHELGRILFQVDPGDADLLPFPVDLQLEPPAGRDRDVVLGNLVALDEVRVGVVLTVELGMLVDRAAEGQARQDRRLHRGLVDHRQHPGHAHAHRADARVGPGRLIVGGAGAEHLAASEHLRVDFEADNGLVLGGGKCRGHEASEAKYIRGRRNGKLRSVIHNSLFSPSCLKAIPQPPRGGEKKEGENSSEDPYVRVDTPPKRLRQ